MVLALVSAPVAAVVPPLAFASGAPFSAVPALLFFVDFLVAASSLAEASAAVVSAALLFLVLFLPVDALESPAAVASALAALFLDFDLVLLSAVAVPELSPEAVLFLLLDLLALSVSVPGVESSAAAFFLVVFFLVVVELSLLWSELDDPACCLALVALPHTNSSAASSARNTPLLTFMGFPPTAWAWLEGRNTLDRSV